MFFDTTYDYRRKPENRYISECCMILTFIFLLLATSQLPTIKSQLNTAVEFAKIIFSSLQFYLLFYEFLLQHNEPLYLCKALVNEYHEF